MTKRQEHSFELGQQVTVSAYVFTKFLHDWDTRWTKGLPDDSEMVHQPDPGIGYSKVLIKQRFQKPVSGIIVGYTWRATGKVHGEWEDAYLQEDKRHKVWLIASNLRYTKPIVALVADITEVT